MLEITNEAQQYFSTMLNKTPDVEGIRVGVKKSGCSGYMMVIAYAHQINDDDHVVHYNDVTVVVDDESLQVIDGSQIDYVSEGLSKKVVLNNPQAISHCGCGESFDV